MLGFVPHPNLRDQSLVILLTSAGTNLWLPRMHTIVAQPTRSRPLEQIVRHPFVLLVSCHVAWRAHYSLGI